MVVLGPHYGPPGPPNLEVWGGSRGGVPRKWPKTLVWGVFHENVKNRRFFACQKINKKTGFSGVFAKNQVLGSFGWFGWHFWPRMVGWVPHFGVPGSARSTQDHPRYPIFVYLGQSGRPRTDPGPTQVGSDLPEWRSGADFHGFIAKSRRSKKCLAPPSQVGSAKKWVEKIFWR